MKAGEHPAASTLDAFLRSALSARERLVVLAHLARGCEHCAAALAPPPGRTLPLRCPGTPGPAEAAREAAAYDAVLDAGLALLRDHESALAIERLEAQRFLQKVKTRRLVSLPTHLATWGACEALLEASFALRYDDAVEMTRLVRWAVGIAEELDPEHYGREALADLRARAWAELANAHRISNQRADSEAAIMRAWEALPAGTGDRGVRARVAELAGALHCHWRQFLKGFELLDEAYTLYLKTGDRHSAGKVLTSKGLQKRRAGDLDAAAALLEAGVPMIDVQRERRLMLHVFHNYTLILVDRGDFREAAEWLPDLRGLHEFYGAGRLDLIRLRGLEGRVAAGLGELAAADRAFREVRREMGAAGLSFLSALAGLDLAGVWLRQGRTAEMRALVAELAEAFKALDVRPEALVALRLLQEAVLRDRATLELIEAVAGTLRGNEHAPAGG